MSDEEIPQELQRALDLLTPEDAEAARQQYLAADEEDRAGMLAFIHSNGPERCRQLRLASETGTPTAADLKDWVP